MKKIIVIVILSIFSLFIIWQIFGICMHKGNLSFTICNESGIDSTLIEIYIDGKKVERGQNADYYTFYSLYMSPKNHTAVIKINGDASQEIKFNTILFTSIYVDYYGDKRSDECGVKFAVITSKWPIQFLS
ncbi:MAG: hypothetical protein ACK5MK_11615 [Dysgonomonas sp.]